MYYREKRVAIIRANCNKTGKFARQKAIYQAVIQMCDIMPEAKTKNCDVGLIFYKNVTFFIGKRVKVT